MSKKGGNQQVTSNVPDPATQARQQAIWDAFNQASRGYNPVAADPATMQALKGYQGISQLGATGASALGGNAGAFANFMNPYQQNVIDATNNEYGTARDAMIHSINQQATQAGAFGGTRADIAQGQGLSNLAQQQAGTIANLTYGGFNDAMNNAYRAANLGMGANAGMANIGDYLRQIEMQQANPALGRADILRQGMVGPSGATQTTQMPSNPLGEAIGGATAGSAFGPIGAGIGGGIGLLGGLFGF